MHTRRQNDAARLIKGDSREVDSVKVLKTLHWLPIRARIPYKILLLAYKALNNLAPPYLKDMLLVQTNVRDTRSSNEGPRLDEKKSNLRFGGDRAHSVCARPNFGINFQSPYDRFRDINVFKRELKN